MAEFEGAPGPELTPQQVACRQILALKLAGQWSAISASQRAALVDACGEDPQVGSYGSSGSADGGLRPAWSDDDEAAFQGWRARRAPWTTADEARFQACLAEQARTSAELTALKKFWSSILPGPAASALSKGVEWLRSLAPEYRGAVEAVDLCLYQADARGAAVANRPADGATTSPVDAIRDRLGTWDGGVTPSSPTPAGEATSNPTGQGLVVLAATAAVVVGALGLLLAAIRR